MQGWLLRLVARLPLPLLHGIGAIIGRAYFGRGKSGKRTRDNLAASGLANDTVILHRLTRQSTAESGKGALETFAIWLRPQQEIVSWVRECRGWEHVEHAWQQQRGIIFLTPHLGCFEITAQYYAAHRPISVLYRPPRQSWLAPLIMQGRERGQLKLAPTTMTGVRDLLKALKRHEAVGILPDQNPGKNEGEWADFFGRPAYTMTLVQRLAETAEATVLLAFGERLPRGQGFRLHIEPFEGEPSPAGINRNIERLVRRKPEQYLWSYPRHRKPRGVERPAAVPASTHDIE